jgi:hypothetical protein
MVPGGKTTEGRQTGVKLGAEATARQRAVIRVSHKRKRQLEATVIWQFFAGALNRVLFAKCLVLSE